MANLLSVCVGALNSNKIDKKRHLGRKRERLSPKKVSGPLQRVPRTGKTAAKQKLTQKNLFLAPTHRVTHTRPHVIGGSRDY